MTKTPTTRSAKATAPKSDVSQVPAADTAGIAEETTAEEAIPVTEEAPVADADRAALSDDDGLDLDGRILHVRSVAKEGRRRAGMAFTPEPIEVYPDQLTADEIGQLLADPQLIVEIG